ncbi:hypothetical protein L6258_03160 [Candidatus Parcubacteria bacterium]|nr:hypothetical protein [Candidatus Parcubacteria bacterium]
MNLSKTLNTLTTVLLCLVALVAPLPLPLPKVFILAALALLLLAAWTGRIFAEDKITLARSPFNLPLLAILGILPRRQSFPKAPTTPFWGFRAIFIRVYSG